MKVKLHKVSGKAGKEVELPRQFDTPVRADIIKKAVTITRKNKVQPHGAKKLAGRTSSAVFRGIRRGYGRSYNWGISRLPRLMVRGGRRVGRVVNVPQAVGGPESHPPHQERDWKRKLNRKERRLAIRSAIAATAHPDVVTGRGHKAPDKLPLVVEGKFEDVEKTKDVVDALKSLGLGEELERASKKKVRAGKGRSRGRKYKRAKGPLLVVSGDCALVRAAANIPGVDVVSVDQLNAELLAPGAHPGRLTIYTEKAIKKMDEDGLFF